MRLPVAGIEFKVAAFAATLVVATAVAVGSWTASQYGQALADKETRDLDVVVASGRSRIAAQGEAVESLVRSLADRPAFVALVTRAPSGPAAREQLRASLDEAAATQPLVAALRVYAPDGAVLAEAWRRAPATLRAPAGSAPFELAHGWHLAAAASAVPGDVVLGPTDAGRPASGERTLLLGGAVLVRDADGRPLATLEAVYDLGALLGDVRAAAVARLGVERIDVLVLDAAGRALGDTGHALQGDAWSPAELASLGSLAVRAESRDGIGPAVVTLGGGANAHGLVAAHRFLAFDLDESTSRGLVLVAVAPLDELLREYTAARNRNLLVTVAILVLATAIVLLYARALMRPLRRMAVAVDRFAAGTAVDELPTLRIDRRDEIGHLESVVEAMMRQVEDRTRRLESEIAERELAERQLLESRRVLADSEIRYRRLYEGIAAGVLTLSTDGRLLSANPAMLRMLGYAAEDDLRARSLAEEVYAGPGTLDAVLARARQHGELSNVEVRLRRRDGLSIVGLATLRAVWDESGTTNAFEATLIDVTDLKLAESQRRSMELRFRRLFDSNSIGVLFGNLHRRTLEDANDRLLELIGLRRSELPLPIATLIPAEHDARAREVARQLADDGRVEPFPMDYLHRDGTRVPVLVSAALVDPARGDFIGVAIDRSAEVDAARRVAEQKAFYELLLDEVPTRIAAVDASERIYFWNRAYRDWFGVGEAPPGRTVEEAVGPGRYAAVAAQIRRALAGETVRFDTEILRDGRRYALDVTYAPTRDAQGRVTGFLSFVHDLTPHRELDERIRENQRLETLTQLTGGIVHDFHNLLSVVIGNLQLLERRAGDDPRLAGPLHSATRAATRGAALTRRFLTFSRPDESRRRVVRAADVLESAAPMLRQVLGSRIALTTGVTAEDARIEVDPEQLENALLNLCANARDALPDGGAVAIECHAAPAPAGATTPREHVVIAVADDGCGMTPDVLAHAFDPFFSTKHHGRGTGLGLAMVHAFVRQAGGTVRVDSAPGRGTRIELWLPRADRLAPMRDATPQESSPQACGQPLCEASGH